MLSWHCCLKQKLCFSAVSCKNKHRSIGSIPSSSSSSGILKCTTFLSIYPKRVSCETKKVILSFLSVNNFGNKNVSCHFTKFLTWRSVISQVPDDGMLKIRRPFYKWLLKSCAMCWPKRWYRTNLLTVSVLVNRSMQVSDTKGVP